MSSGEKAGAVLYAKDIGRVAEFYRQVAGMEKVEVDGDYFVLEAPGFQLTVVAIPRHLADTIALTSPPTRRGETALKLMFPVASLAAAREAAFRFGGELNPAEREWTFWRQRICDGCDPEGNMLQLREPME